MFQTFIYICIHIICSSVNEEAGLSKRELCTSFSADRDTEQSE